MCAGLSVVGRVTFSSSDAYSSRDAWAADESRHLVLPTSEGYGWKGPRSVFAWTVGEVTAYSKPRAVRGMRRALKSLFEVDPHRRGESGGATEPGNSSGRGVSVDVGADIGGDGGAQQSGSSKKKRPKKKRKKKGGGGPSLAGEGLPPVGDNTAKAEVEAVAPTAKAVVVGEETSAIASPLTKSEKTRLRDEKVDVLACEDAVMMKAEDFKGDAAEHDNGVDGGRWRVGGRRRKRKKPRNEAVGREGDRGLNDIGNGRCDGESRTGGPVGANSTTTSVRERKKSGGKMGAAKKREGGGETLVSKPVKRKRF